MAEIHRIASRFATRAPRGPQVSQGYRPIDPTTKSWAAVVMGFVGWFAFVAACAVTFSPFVRAVFIYFTI